ncbi:hypothetical protein DT594_08770 [Halopseudomonas laoshanensis]|uniref:Type 4 fimbrial biogenesis protein PilX N-terminal domain-containing protein n=1 Tax=Halopseudomonas laoshanensis TaxID=2268758 RepID=A0A7V7GUS3_9GAMM|nr:PilX N-terminal domain-containing pilus assembly protein [Halopseudomonas laoshanensis]KAA0694955.1 hypothetical protein DT594_08770 [Halopseudomonas laoshanensis]
MINALKHRQSGAALLVALIMLLVSTLLGLASIRGTTLNEKMSSNMYDRSLSYQAAESALRAAEVALQADTTLGIDCTNINERCPPIPENTFSMSDVDGWENVDASYLVNEDLLGDSSPQYYIEKMGEVGGSAGLGQDSDPRCNSYNPPSGCIPPPAAQFRITARSGVPAADGRSVVALQITVKQNL